MAPRTLVDHACAVTRRGIRHFEFEDFASERDHRPALLRFRERMAFGNEMLRWREVAGARSGLDFEVGPSKFAAECQLAPQAGVRRPSPTILKPAVTKGQASNRPVITVRAMMIFREWMLAFLAGGYSGQAFHEQANMAQPLPPTSPNGART